MAFLTKRNNEIVKTFSLYDRYDGTPAGSVVLKLVRPRSRCPALSLSRRSGSA